MTNRLHVHLVGAVLALGIIHSNAPTTASAQATKPAAADDPHAQARADVVLANHILADQGVVDGFGHVSIRDPADPNKFLMARSMAPELVTPADVLEHDLEGNTTAPATTK